MIEKIRVPTITAIMIAPASGQIWKLGANQCFDVKTVHNPNVNGKT
jgi:hypothetical protein